MPSESKSCSACREVKSLTLFYRSKSRPDGHHGQCKECMKKGVNKDLQKERIARWNSENPNYQRDYKSEYRVRKADFLREKSRIYRQENAELIREKSSQYYLNNKESILERTRQYYKDNPDVYRRAQARRRALEASAPTDGYLPTAGELADFYGKACLFPNCSNTDPTLDHVVPLSRGGSHRSDNFQPLCQSHNSSKHTLSTDYRNGRIYSKEGDEHSDICQ